MKSTADRYREAGMPPPRDEMYIPLGSERSQAILREVPVPDVRRPLRKTRKRTVANPPLVERVHDPAADGPVLPEIDPAAYGPDSVPLDTPDADNTEETS